MKMMKNDEEERGKVAREVKWSKSTVGNYEVGAGWDTDTTSRNKNTIQLLYYGLKKGRELGIIKLLLCIEFEEG